MNFVMQVNEMKASEIGPSPCPIKSRIFRRTTFNFSLHNYSLASEDVDATSSNTAGKGIESKRLDKVGIRDVESLVFRGTFGVKNGQRDISVEIEFDWQRSPGSEVIDGTLYNKLVFYVDARRSIDYALEGLAHCNLLTGKNCDLNYDHNSD